MITWDDSAAVEETAAAAYTRMTATEQTADRAYERAVRQGQRAEWAARWPNHCWRCDGRGWENVLVGCGEECEVEGETCSGCVDQRHCPRCGGALTDFACGCGWSINSDAGGMPAELLDFGATDFNDMDFTDPFAEVTS